MFLYTALGDSITAGEGATGWPLAYPSLITGMLQKRSTGTGAAGEVLAHPGWTSRDLNSAVLENSSIYLRDSQAITVWVGGDNLAYAGIAALHGAPSSVIAKSIRQYSVDIVLLIGIIRKVSRARIILCTQYNPFPNSAIAAQGIAALNEATCAVASKLNTALAPAATWFEGRQGELIRGYRTGRLQDVQTSPLLPIHPNNRGHQVIANGLAPIIGGGR